MALELVHSLDPNHPVSKVLQLEPKEYDTEAYISSMFSLYFQWKSHCRAIFYVNDEKKFVNCDIDYDQDLRNPTELFINFKETCDLNQLKESMKLKFRLEIFGVCYEFFTEALGWKEFEDDPFDVVVEIPRNILVFKEREHRRIIPNKLQNDQMCKDASIILNKNELLIDEVYDISLNAFVCKFVEPPNSLEKGRYDEIYLQYGSTQVSLKYIDKKGESYYLFKLNETRSTSLFSYFLFYSVAAYPYFRKRTPEDHEELIDLYKEQGYTKVFEGCEYTLPQIKEGWREVDTEKENLTGYNLLGEVNGVIRGASSITKIEDPSNKKKIFLWHQTVAQTSPEILELSGNLYKWRAELALLLLESEDQNMIWFKSGSRWLERIYTKFKRFTHQSVELSAVKLFKVDHVLSTQKGISAIHRYSKIDKREIVSIANTTQNISSICSFYCRLDGNFDDNVFTKIEQTLRKIGIQNKKLVYSINSDDTYSPKGYVSPTDRLIKFSRDCCLDFISSIDHSLCVTKAKYG